MMDCFFQSIFIEGILHNLLHLLFFHPANHLIAHLASPPIWSTSPFPWPAILKIHTTGILKVVDKHCMASKCWADLYCALQLSLSMIWYTSQALSEQILLTSSQGQVYKGLIMALINFYHLASKKKQAAPFKYYIRTENNLQYGILR